VLLVNASFVQKFADEILSLMTSVEILLLSLKTLRTSRFSVGYSLLTRRCWISDHIFTHPLESLKL